MSSEISVYSLPDLKNTTDEALPNYLNSLKFSQDHTLTDVRLALGYASIAISAATFALDYKLEWDATKTLTLVAVVVYFLLQGVLTAWTMFVEKNTVYQGTKDGQKVKINSHVARYTPIYELEFEVDSKPGKNAESYKINSPFSRWFTKDGTFVAPAFQSWLSSEIPMVKTAATTLKGKKGN